MPVIDIVNIKSKVKNGEFKFFLKDGIIYLKDNKTEEIVAVGEYTQHKTSMYADGNKIMEIEHNE